MKLVELRNLLVWTRTRTTSFFDKFYLTSSYLTSFICLCGRTKLPVFPSSSKLVQKLELQKGIQRSESSLVLTIQASKRKPETEVANKYTTPGSMQPAAQFQTKLARLLTEVFCYSWSSAREVVGPRNYNCS